MTEAERVDRAWEHMGAQPFAVCMAFDAFRIALGGKPQHFQPSSVILWLECRSAIAKEKPNG